MVRVLTQCDHITLASVEAVLKAAKEPIARWVIVDRLDLYRCKTVYRKLTSVLDELENTGKVVCGKFGRYSTTKSKERTK